MDHQIVPLPKAQWKGYVLPMTYRSEQYCDVTMAEGPDGFSVEIRLKDLDEPFVCDPARYDFPDRLYADWWEEAEAYGVVVGGELKAAIELCPEGWSNRLRVTELWVAPELQRKGIGRALIELAKAETIRQGRRLLMLETQSCNANAIAFYRAMGFTLIGFDSTCYSNDDLARREVRLEMGWKA